MIIFLYGPDTFRSRRKLKQLKEKFIREIDKSALNIEILDGQTLETADFEKAISTPAFLAKKRMVIIENLISKNKGQKVQKEILEKLAKNNLEDTIIIFWEGELTESKSKRTKTAARRSNLLFNRLKKEKYAQEFQLLGNAETYNFAKNEINSRQAKIDSQALRLLVDLTGNDLWQLNSEVDKLVSFCKNKTITTADVEKMVKSKLDDDIFKLTDALGQKNKKAALKLISDQLKSGTSPTELLAKITWQFKNLLLVKNFYEENGPGYPGTRLGFQLGLHPFVIKKTASQIKNYDIDNLKKTYNRLLKIDWQIKTSQIEPEVLFDLLVVKS